MKAQQVELIGTSGDGQFSSGLFSTLNSGATGKAGNLSVETDSLVVRSGAEVSAGVFGNGNGGTLAVKAHQVELIGTSGDGTLPSGLFSALNRGATGQVGNLSVDTDSLVVSSGAEISTAVFGNGNGGTLAVKAHQVELIGTSFDDQFSSGLFSALNSGATGNAGNLSVETDSLIVRSGAVVTSGVFGNGNGGTLAVKAHQVELIGTSPDGQYPSSLNTSADIGASGNGGNLLVDTGRLTVADGAQVSTSSFGATSAGDLTINAPQLLIRDRSQIRATSQSGNGGNLIITAPNFLLLRNFSNISTSAGLENAGGDGGNININAGFVLGVPLENSDITANAYRGRGGNINITTNGIYGIQYRPQTTALSDITASSQFGINGTVNLFVPEIDPTAGLTQLPFAIIDPADQIIAGCPADRDARFVVTGRGGIPEYPRQTLLGQVVMQDFRSPDVRSYSAQNIPLPNAPLQERGNFPQIKANVAAALPYSPIVEAKGWVMDKLGNVVLVANQPNFSRSSSSDEVTCGSLKR
ncbi:MAG: S-layer family protein [Rhizonema sp. NSF051]|nr:S-layer family protein [Rhizonema sp. NSF051]